MNFHIASRTEMSSKLLALNKVKNINLYPKSSEKNVLILCQTCDMYLDINKGKEIFEGVKLAFMHQMLLFGYEETMHNQQFINRNYIFKAIHYKELSDLLKEISMHQTLFSTKLNEQLQYANSISKTQFQNKVE